jgi:hypothetical protein
MARILSVLGGRKDHGKISHNNVADCSLDELNSDTEIGAALYSHLLF